MKKKISIILSVVLFFVMMLYTQQSFINTPIIDEVIQMNDGDVPLASLENDGLFLDEIIVKFYDRSQFPGKEKQYDDEVIKILKDGLSRVTENVYVIKADGLSRNTNAFLNRFKNSDFIEYVEPNYIASFGDIPDDPNYKTLLATLNALNATDGWAIEKSGGPIVAIVDSGIISNHPDLPARVANYSVAIGTVATTDIANHGTGVAGTVGAIGNNGIGTVGINWNARIMNVKVDDVSGVLSVANIATGIRWAVDNGARIINLSLSTTSDSVTLKSAIDYAYNNGVALFAATGNQGTSTVNYPARYSNVMGVGMSANGTTRSAASNYGSGLDVMGLSAYNTTNSSGGYANMSGTSFATPQVSGLASLIWAINSNLTNSQVYELIKQGATPLGGGFNTQTGYGLINVGKTLELAKATLPPSSTQKHEPVVINPPILTMIGESLIQLDIGGSYLEPGFKAIDEIDGDITNRVIIKSTLDCNKVGAYTIDYAVTNTSGLSTTSTRRIIVNEEKQNELKLQEQTQIHSFLSEALFGTRNDYTGSVGYEFELKTDVIVTALGRPQNEMMKQSHMIYIWSVRDQSIVARAEVTPNSYLDEMGFKKIDLDIPILLYSGEKYRIVSDEISGGDAWYDVRDTKEMTLSDVGDFTTSVWSEQHGHYPVNTYDPIGIRGHVGLTFYYTLKGEDIKQESPNDYPTVTNPSKDQIAEIPDVPRSTPIIKLIGSNPILLHLGSETVYIEQGSYATDEVDGDISHLITVNGSVNRNAAGTYNITYSVTNSAGLSASVERQVKIVSSEVINEPRQINLFNEQAKKGDKPIVRSIEAKAQGTTTLEVAGLNKFSVSVTITDVNGERVFQEIFTGNAIRELNLTSGVYNVSSEVTEGSGNNKYTLKVTMPIVSYERFNQPEVPLSPPIQHTNYTELIILSTILIIGFGGAYYLLRKNKVQ